MDIEELRDLLKIDKHQLDAALEINASISDLITRRVAALRKQLGVAKRDADIAHIRAVTRVKKDDPGLTNPQAEKAALEDANLWAVQQGYMNLAQELEEWEGLQKTWYQRGFDLKVLGELYGHDYYTLDSVATTRPHASQREVDRMRAAIRAQSERINSEREAITRPARRRHVD